MHPTQNRLSSRTQAQITTRLIKRRARTSRAAFCRRRPSKLPSSSKRSAIVISRPRRRILALEPTLISIIQTTHPSARVCQKFVKIERLQSHRESKSAFLALILQDRKTHGSTYAMRTLGLVAITLRVCRQRLTSTSQSLESLARRPQAQYRAVCPPAIPLSPRSAP